MTNPIDGGPAFPCPPTAGAGGADGMTLHDYFCGQALAGTAGGNTINMAAGEIVRRADRIADEMISLREHNRRVVEIGKVTT